MAKMDTGLIRSVSGKLGNVVAVKRREGNYLRMKATKVNNPKTEAQQSQRAKFSLVMRFVKPLTPVVKIGFKYNPLGKTPYNYACAWVMQNAVSGTYPEQEIDFASVIISEGDLCQFIDLKAEIESGVMKFSWTHEGSERFGGWAETDKALLVVYNVTKKQVGYSFGESTRLDLNGEIVLPGYFFGDTLLAYAAYVSVDGLHVSTSQFAGSMVMN